jgi:hypothetical protein
MRQEAARLAPLVASDLGKAFLEATADLPEGEARTIYKARPPATGYRAQAEVDALDEAERGALEKVELTAEQFYTTRYGTPMAIARPIDVLGRAGLDSLRGRKVLDFGYGTIGHLRLLALMGAEAVGVDVDTFLTALYCRPGDQGSMRTSRGEEVGRVRLVHGHWPATSAVREQIGGGYDLIISKNTLKRGYIHPAREVDPRRLVHLGVDDGAFCAALFESLRPGGYLIIYNLSPPQNPPDQPYLPWADGECPFSRAQLEGAGFEVIAFDVDDSAEARAMGRALAWDQGTGAMDLETGLFGHYTLARRP